MQDIFLKCFRYFTKIFKEVTHYYIISTFYSLEGYVEKYMLRSMLNWVEQTFKFDCAIYYLEKRNEHKLRLGMQQ